MTFDKPIIKSDIENIGYLAPIPIFQKVYTDSNFHDEVYKYGFENLSEQQKLMGQELPEQYDKERAKLWDVQYLNGMEWVEQTEHNPIGSRFYVPPNNVLDSDYPGFKEIRKRVIDSYCYLLDNMGIKYKNVQLTESWMQYYPPTEGRGHNQHNHCRWQPEEYNTLGFSGGYYLSDGDPVKDHPYSGVFTFHIRGFSYFIRPQKGMLMIWPNDIVHSVKPFYGKTHRCVINFNIQSERIK